MKTLTKDQLIDGAYYEGFDMDEYPRIARWDAGQNLFFANAFSWEEVYTIPMTFEGELVEYFIDFSPVAVTMPRQEEIVPDEECFFIEDDYNDEEEAV